MSPLGWGEEGKEIAFIKMQKPCNKGPAQLQPRSLRWMCFLTEADTSETQMSDSAELVLRTVTGWCWNMEGAVVSYSWDCKGNENWNQLTVLNLHDWAPIKTY